MSIFILIATILLPYRASAQDTVDNEEISIIEEWREVLLYGIDSEILTLITRISGAKEQSLNPELVLVLQESGSTDVKKAVIEYLTDSAVVDAHEAALKILQDYEEIGSDLIISTIYYLSETGNTSMSDVLVEIIDLDDENVVSAAVRALGKSKDTTKEEILLKRLEDEYNSESLNAAIILALGDLQSLKSVDRLIEIAEDREDNRVLRMYACDSLGKIGDERALPVLMNLVSESDTLIRAYAVSALTHFRLNEEILTLLMQGLRDSNWQVRLACTKALARNEATGAIAILQYKAKRDPETKVRLEAVSTLGVIGTSEAFEFLRDLFQNERTLLSIRERALESLLVHDLNGSLETIRTVVKQEIVKTDQKVIEFIGRHLSVASSKQFEDMYVMFLEHANPVIKIYGIRGIGNNSLSSLKIHIEDLLETSRYAVVRKEALAAIAKLDAVQ